MGQAASAENHSAALVSRAIAPDGAREARNGSLAQPDQARSVGKYSPTHHQFFA